MCVFFQAVQARFNSLMTFRVKYHMRPCVELPVTKKFSCIYCCIYIFVLCQVVFFSIFDGKSLCIFNSFAAHCLGYG